MLLHSFENNFMAVGGDVEVANVEVGRKVGQLSLCTCLEIDEPEILVLNVSSEEDKCSSARERRTAR